MNTGIVKEGKKFVAYNNGEVIGRSYIERSAEIILEKATGNYIEKRGRKINNTANLIFGQPPVLTDPIVFAPIPEIATPVFRTDQEIYDDIKMRFDTLDTMVQASLCDLNRSMIISAPAGIGKSFGVMKALEESGCKHIIIKGHVTPRQLYVLLYENRFSDNIICFDDSDGIFADELSLNLLKSACDSSDLRHIDWFSSKAIIDSDGQIIPNSFEFDASVIFITNKNFTEEIDKNTKLSVHFEALRSRSHYMSLGIHTKRDYIIRIKQVVNETNILGDISETLKKEILNFIEDNKERLMELSLRIVKKISDLIKISSSDWRSLAEVTLMK